MSTELDTNPVDGGTDLIAVLKDVVKQSGLSLNKIATESGLNQSQLHRFVTGERTLSLVSAAKLFAYFKLEIVVPTPLTPESATSQTPPQLASPAKKPKK
ncbi:helix-turn-helix domain-containing protein [Gemmata obscuriglobus]|uniref:XRE family transcriptional regulator n=1 Tax=Gemmata obscuriglobus TaxID=114 RepID=A0A2Z3H3C6_9BACT|nr:helix-turn-helix transcriptional regulator [Gemmata obscuriglobus]AWM39361.1 XRE family transcriptional regulator [Gemmata obscuriglobus]